MVSDLCGVILILFVIIDELWEFINKTLKGLLVYIVTKTCRVHSRCQTGVLCKMCDTAPSCSKPSATRWGMIFQWNVIVIMFAVCYECVMNVLWMCYESVMKVLWECYESVMRVLWERYESVMDVLWMCYGCVIDVLWMCYGCVMGVLWMCEVCYGRVKDVCVMDEWWIFYIYCVSCIVNGIVIVIL